MQAEEKRLPSGLKWADPIYAPNQRLVDADGQIVGSIKTNYWPAIEYHTDTGRRYIDAASARTAVERAAIGEEMP